MDQTDSIFENLARDALESEYFKELYQRAQVAYGTYILDCSINPVLTDSENDHLLRFADLLSLSERPEPRKIAYTIVSLLYHLLNADEVYIRFAEAVLSRLGNFPGLQYFGGVDQISASLPFERRIKLEEKRVIQEVPALKDRVFTDAQYGVYRRLVAEKEFSFSGPTSMGKSFIIKACISRFMQNTPRENIAVIVPTRALISQFARELNQELRDGLDKYNYRVLTSSAQDVNSIDVRAIYVLTPERLISLLNRRDKNPSLAYMFVDEAHRLADMKDERSITLYHAINRALEVFKGINVYFASPNVLNPDHFLEYFGRNSAHALSTLESPVSQQLFVLDYQENRVSQVLDGNMWADLTGLYGIGVSDQFQDLRHIGKGYSNIVYCNSKVDAIRFASEFSVLLKGNSLSHRLSKSAERLRSYVHERYKLAGVVEAGVAFHYGALPELVRTEVERLFQAGDIKYLFCTSTLLEGVNLPAHNVFILNAHRGQGAMKSIDFWNLAGRAGRLTKELSGNIFCLLKENHRFRLDEYQRERQSAVEITVAERVRRNTSRISKILAGDHKNKGDNESRLLEYIANLLCVEQMVAGDSSQELPSLRFMEKTRKAKLLELINSRAEAQEIPPVLASAFCAIDVSIQSKVYAHVIAAPKGGRSSALPKVTFESCLSTLEIFYELYEWGEREKGIKTKQQLRYYAQLMNKWVHGHSLKSIIQESIDRSAREKRDVYIAWENDGPFNPVNDEHLNSIIERCIADIDKILRFTLEKYFSHYYSILEFVLGVEEAGPNWAQYLEFGTMDKIEMGLQARGLSRHTAHLVNRNHRRGLLIENGSLVDVKWEQLIMYLAPDSIEYLEISAFAGKS